MHKYKTSATRLESARQWKTRNAERCRELNKERNAKIRSDPVLWAAKMEANRQSAKRTRAKRNEYDSSRDPVKIKARNRVKQLIRTGKLIRQPCEKCGKPNAQAHHDDYNKPLDVKWLCPYHHKQHHKNESTLRHPTN